MKLFIKKTTSIASVSEERSELPGFLGGFRSGVLQSHGLLEIVSLQSSAGAKHSQFAPATEWLKLVQVPSYGTMVLRNASPDQLLLVPMHVGFFQHGAQNHATSRTLIMDAGETLRVEDCFCIQAAQGGLLQQAEQRFLMLPAGLRAAALSKKGVNSYGRLWGDIETYTRRFGVAQGGHLERFLRPYFSRLQRFRHAFEPTAGQRGAAYFVAGKLTGVEIGPSERFFHDLFPILSIYCYGPSAVLAERDELTHASESVDLNGLLDLDDLAQRLDASRSRQQEKRMDQLRALFNKKWEQQVEEDRHGVRILNVHTDDFIGQAVRNDEDLIYLSVFRGSVA